MATGRTALQDPQRWKTLKHYRWHYLFLLPMVILFAAFTLWPMIAAWVYSLYSWDGYGPLEDFVGLQNFADAMSDSQFWFSIRNTFLFTLAAVAIQMPLALILALVLNGGRLTGRNVYRILVFLPVVTTTAVVGTVFIVLLNPWAPGPANTALMSTGVVDQAINFLGESGTALPTLIAIDLWKDFGVVMIYWLAALQTVPRDVLESASIDGAGRWQTLRHITLPMLLPLAVIILLLVTQRSFNAFDIVWSMTQGGPNGSTDIVQTYIYQLAFSPDLLAPRFGFASAASLVFGVLVTMVALVQALVLRRIRGKREDAGSSGKGAAS